VATDLDDAHMPELPRVIVEVLRPMIVGGASVPPGYLLRTSADLATMLLHQRRARWPRARAPSIPKT
jgi:hypothetical protein